MKIVFFGTPDISRAFLERIIEDGFDISAVVTQPDKISGRGLDLRASPVKEKALVLKIPVYQPEDDADLKNAVLNLKPDLCVVVAYGRFIKEDALKSAKTGFLNVHFSLLPKYRGAAPVQWALLNGEKETGVSVFWIEKGMDTGPIFVQKKVKIEIRDNAENLFAKLSETGKNMIVECLCEIKKGKIRKISQSGEPSLAPAIKKEFSWLDFNKTAFEVYNKIRGLSAGHKARFKYSLKDGAKKMSQVLKASFRQPPSKILNFAPGQIVRIEKGKGFYVKCLDECVFIERVKPEGKKEMSAFDFANGFRLREGGSLTAEH